MTGTMAAGFARALHALNEVDPDKAAEITEWFRGPFDEGPDSEEHTDWLERKVAGSPAVLSKWVASGRQMADEGRANAEAWEQQQRDCTVTPISDAFPEGAAMVRLKTALAEFRSKGQVNTLADDLDTAIRFVEFTRDDIRQLRASWAAMSGCLARMSQGKSMADTDLAGIPASHREILLGLQEQSGARGGGV